MGKSSTPSDALREFMLAHAGEGSENIGPYDVTWTGGGQDADSLIEKHGYDPQGPLELLLLAIISGHPDSRGNSLSRQRRLEIALSALTGRPRSRGADASDDYDTLLRIAGKYHEAEFASLSEPAPSTISLAKIVRECLPDVFERLVDGENSEVRRLKNKFKEAKDVLLSRVTSESDFERLDAIRSIRQIAEQLRALGVSADPTAIRPRLRRRD